MAQSWFYPDASSSTIATQDGADPTAYDQSQVAAPSAEDVQASTVNATAVSVGLGDTSGQAAWFAAATGTAAASASVLGLGAAVVVSSPTAAGQGSAVFVGASRATATGSTGGVSAVSGVGQSNNSSVGPSAGAGGSVFASSFTTAAAEILVTATGTAGGSGDAFGASIGQAAAQPDPGGAVSQPRRGVWFRGGVERSKLWAGVPGLAEGSKPPERFSPLSAPPAKPAKITKADRVARALEDAAQARQREAAIRAAEIAMQALADAVAARNMANGLTAEMIVAEEEQIAVLVSVLALAA